MSFEDELKYMLATQMAAPNSPQWFNTGLNHKYELTAQVKVITMLILKLRN